MNHRHELPFLTCGTHSQCPYSNFIGSRIQVVEHETVVAAPLLHPFSSVHTVLIENVLTAEFRHAQLQGEMIVAVVQVDTSAVVEHTLQHHVLPRFLTFVDGPASHIHIHQFQVQVVSRFLPCRHPPGIEVSDAADSTEIELSIVGKHGTAAELVVLNAIGKEEVGEGFGFHVHARQAIIGANP